MPWKDPKPTHPIVRPRDQAEPRDINCILGNWDGMGFYVP
jgi:hypothetical protein